MKTRNRRYVDWLRQIPTTKLAIAAILLGTLAYVAEPAIGRAGRVLDAAASGAPSANASSIEQESMAPTRAAFLGQLERTEERRVRERLLVTTTLLIVLVLFIFQILSKADRYNARVKLGHRVVDASASGQPGAQDRARPADASERSGSSSVLERVGGVFLGLGIPILLCSIWISGETLLQGWISLSLYTVSVFWLLVGTMLLLLSTYAPSRGVEAVQSDPAARRKHPRAARRGRILITREAPRQAILGVCHNVSQGGIYAEVPCDSGIDVGERIMIDRDPGSDWVLDDKSTNPIDARVARTVVERSDSDGTESLGLGLAFEVAMPVLG